MPYYSLTDTDPPQSLTLGFDPVTFSNNFNLMSLLYLLPLIAVIPFVPLKAKCVRRLSIIEMGHKWVDLFLGEIYLFMTLFNYQYFLFSLIVYYQDGRNVKNYGSTMIIWIGGLVTLCTFIGLVFKPEIYGNFRTVFRYNKEIMSAAMEEKEKIHSYEENITLKF